MEAEWRVDWRQADPQLLQAPGAEGLHQGSGQREWREGDQRKGAVKGEVPRPGHRLAMCGSVQCEGGPEAVSLGDWDSIIMGEGRI